MTKIIFLSFFNSKSFIKTMQKYGSIFAKIFANRDSEAGHDEILSIFLKELILVDWILSENRIWISQTLGNQNCPRKKSFQTSGQWLAWTLENKFKCHYLYDSNCDSTL